MGVIGMRSKPPRPIKYICTKALLIFVIGMQKGSSIYPQLNDRDWLYQKYWIERLTCRAIAELVGCEATAVLKALKRLGIPRRTNSEAHKGAIPQNKGQTKYPELRDEDWLYQKYWIEELSIHKIANIVGCSDYAVWCALLRFNILMRNKSEAVKGEKNPSWNGGTSFLPYCPAFNEKFKEYIRDKFGRVCFLCPKTEKENGRKLSVHHVNYNKDCFCEEDVDCQFVPLCIRCHVKTNRNREFWEKVIISKLHEKINGWYI